MPESHDDRTEEDLRAAGQADLQGLAGLVAVGLQMVQHARARSRDRSASLLLTRLQAPPAADAAARAACC